MFFHMKWESHSLFVVVDTQLVDMLFERFDDTLVERSLDDWVYVQKLVPLQLQTRSEQINTAKIGGALSVPTVARDEFTLAMRPSQMLLKSCS